MFNETTKLNISINFTKLDMILIIHPEEKCKHSFYIQIEINNQKYDTKRDARL